MTPYQAMHADPPEDVGQFIERFSPPDGRSNFRAGCLELERVTEGQVTENILKGWKRRNTVPSEHRLTVAFAAVRGLYGDPRYHELQILTAAAWVGLLLDWITNDNRAQSYGELRHPSQIVARLTELQPLGGVPVDGAQRVSDDAVRADDGSDGAGKTGGQAGTTPGGS